VAIIEGGDSWSRWYRPAMFGATVVLLAIGAIGAWLAFSRAAAVGRAGADLSLYLDATRRVLSGGSFYLERQLAGPYVLADGDILYPPTLIILFAAFLILPAALFWLIPLGITTAVLIHHRPAPWAWPLMALGLAYPVSTLKIVHGNPFMWIAAAIALGTTFAWPSVFVLLKPSLAPFALIGIRHRSWWLALAIGVVVSALFGSLWLDYVRVVTNSRNPVGALYSLDEVPLMLVPVIAWIASPHFRGPARR
jgi:hypothetical protein